MITDKERHERAKNFRDMISARNYGIPGTVGSFVDIDDLLSELLGRRLTDSIHMAFGLNDKDTPVHEALGMLADIIEGN